MDEDYPPNYARSSTTFYVDENGLWKHTTSDLNRADKIHTWESTAMKKKEALDEALMTHTEAWTVPPDFGDNYDTILDTLSKPAMQRQAGGAHYKNLAIQPLEYAQRNQLNYAEANVVKYVSRHRQKGGREDIEKAIHMLECLLELEYPIDEVFDEECPIGEDTA